MQAAPLLGGNADWKTALENGGYNKKYDKFNDIVSDEATFNVIQEAKPPGLFSDFLPEGTDNTGSSITPATGAPR
jgi:hypothetical protein